MNEKLLEALVEKGVYISHWINDGGCLGDKEEGYNVGVFGWNIQSFDTEAAAQQWLPIARQHVLDTLKGMLEEIDALSHSG